MAVVVMSSLGVLAVTPADGRPPWALPGGKIERRERLEQAVVREVREETGCEVRLGRVLESKGIPQSAAVPSCP